MDVLDRAFKSNKRKPQILELLSELTEGCLAALNFETFCVSLNLLIVVRIALFLCATEDELLVQDLSKFAAEFVAKTNYKHILGVELDHTHQRLVELKHAFSEQRDLMSLFSELKTLFMHSVLLQELFADFNLKVLDLISHERANKLELLEDLDWDDLKDALDEVE